MGGYWVIWTLKIIPQRFKGILDGGILTFLRILPKRFEVIIESLQRIRDSLHVCSPKQSCEAHLALPNFVAPETPWTPALFYA